MSSSLPPSEYAGDLATDAAWTMLKDNPAAQLVDVRTTAEWSFVGVPTFPVWAAKCTAWNGRAFR